LKWAESQYNLNKGAIRGFIRPRELPMVQMPGRKKGYDGAHSDHMAGANPLNLGMYTAMRALSGSPYPFYPPPQMMQLLQMQQLIQQMNGMGMGPMNGMGMGQFPMNGMGGMGQFPMNGMGGMGQFPMNGMDPMLMNGMGMGNGQFGPYGQGGFNVSP